jgi:hypothetical protein
MSARVLSVLRKNKIRWLSGHAASLIARTRRSTTSSGRDVRRWAVVSVRSGNSSLVTYDATSAAYTSSPVMFQLSTDSYAHAARSSKFSPPRGVESVRLGAAPKRILKIAGRLASARQHRSLGKSTRGLRKHFVRLGAPRCISVRGRLAALGTIMRDVNTEG